MLLIGPIFVLAIVLLALAEEYLFPLIAKVVKWEERMNEKKNIVPIVQSSDDLTDTGLTHLSYDDCLRIEAAKKNDRMMIIHAKSLEEHEMSTYEAEKQIDVIMNRDY